MNIEKHYGEDGWNNMRRVAAGEMLAHVWTSDTFPGALVQVKYTELEAAGDTAPDIDHGLPEDFAQSIELKYAGTLSPQDAADRVAIHDASHGIEQSPSN